MSFRLLAHFRAVVADLHPDHVESAVHGTMSGLNEAGGSSINLHGKPTPTHGWMVGGVAREKHIPGGIENVSPDAVRHYIHENSHHLSNPDHYLGSWHDTHGNKVALDVSKHFSNRNEAHAYARLHNEDAVYNLHEGKEEPTDWEGKRRPERVRA